MPMSPSWSSSITPVLIAKHLSPRLETFLRTDKRVKLVVKEFPILTPESLLAAKASLASMKQGKYREFHQALMMFKGGLQEFGNFRHGERRWS